MGRGGGVQDDTKIILARHDERIADLENWRDRQYKTLEGIQQELKQLREDYHNRPTWAVTVLISLLGTAAGSMAVFIITSM